MPIDTHRRWDEGEADLIALTQQALTTAPLITAARMASQLGEHSGGWVAAAAVAAVTDPGRRELWLRAGGAAFVAHAAAVTVIAPFVPSRRTPVTRPPHSP